MSIYRAHDLLWVNGMPVEVVLPAWASSAWLQRAPLVVRRASTAPGRIPIGLRGPARRDRHAGEIEATTVLRCITPEMLSAIPVHNASCAALEALRTLTPLMHATGWSWGPTGGVGFALASGLPVLRADSDLDLVVRIATEPDAAQVAMLRDIAASVSACRLDLQIDTGHGGFAYAEWAARRAKIMLKTALGPLLTASPWDTQWGAKCSQDLHKII